ncbi:hypothetical protein X743_07290 [Mesorhizobium sp. LNHC252B00]|nr:hypothetical protein X743_07290 [Mesorhizobium sp. LNHC252B00]
MGETDVLRKPQDDDISVRERGGSLEDEMFVERRAIRVDAKPAWACPGGLKHACQLLQAAKTLRALSALE